MNTRTFECESILHEYACGQIDWKQANKQCKYIGIELDYQTWTGNMITGFDKIENKPVTLYC